ncbi:hypothetical protein FCS83_01475 [Oenococcus sp. UCMA 17063]|nr:hypothetical protein [Oenococcus sp. UCMA 17063]
MTVTSKQTLSDLNDFQKEIHHDAKQLFDFDNFYNSFLKSKTISEAVNTVGQLIKNNRNDYRQFNPLFRFDDSFWIAQLVVKLFHLKHLDYFSNLDSNQQISNQLRIPAFPGFEFFFSTNTQFKNDGFYLQERNLQIDLFYLDIFNKEMFINADGFANLINSRIGRNLADKEIRAFTKIFITLAKILHEDNFSIDLNLLQSGNNQMLPLRKVDLPAIVTDQLFVLAQSQQKDIFALDNGFQIDFNEEMSLYLIQAIDSIGHSQWFFKVFDTYDRWTFLDVLAKYNWFLKWYLDNLNYLKIAYRDDLFLG